MDRDSCRVCQCVLSELRGRCSIKSRVIPDFIVCSRTAWAIELRSYLTTNVKRVRGPQDLSQM